MARKVEREVFLEVVETIKRRFPYLQASLQEEHPHVETLLTIPAQEELPFEVRINLQNCDELHLNAGKIWCEWFPCRKKEITDQFVEAVCGLLSGEFRIVEYSRKGETFKAELQRPEGEAWTIVARWSKMHLPFGRVTTQILQKKNKNNHTLLGMSRCGAPEL